MANILRLWRLARFDKPVGIWLLLLPCWFGLGLAGYKEPHLYGLFALGAAAMRGAGCVINDIIDRKFDAMVERTKTRPIASGEISVPIALAFLAVLLALGLFVLLQLPKISILMGFLVMPLVLAYPFMKRITNWPQLFLGITFNIGALVAYTAVTQEISTSSFILYLSCIFWTLGYDTIYAHQDKEDDLKIGVKSTAIAFGAKSRLLISVFYKLFILGFSWAAFISINFTLTTLGVLCLGYVLLMWQVITMNETSAENCLLRFKANSLVGLLLVAALLV